MGVPAERDLQKVERLLSQAVTLLQPHLAGASPSRRGRAAEEEVPARPSPPDAADGRAEVEIRCFGGFRIAVRGVAVNCEAARPKVRSLLRLLALRAGTPVHRDVLLDALWPDLTYESGVRNLQVTVSRLRTLLEPGARPGSATLLTRDEQSYGLALGSGLTSDVREFDRLSAACLLSAGGMGAEQAIVALRAALGWYGGDLLPEAGASEWVVGERRRLQARAARLHAALAGRELELGRAGASAAAAEQALALDPYLDEAWRTLVAAQEAAGAPAAAAKCRRAYARTLRALGVGPDAATAPSGAVSGA
ncbi:AfsR/SARP family transcriptional regulator [Streptomyces sp. SBT349]|uniref:AfsR/SARP family transcriptional regulator n=1 Tax=Streptomyces sp. SBT349 TaxID=1580539 RepID=UPI00066D402E|nr:BTAD domain-containing putative transcriptional regulator [Streptomyces sp. SBT349]